MKITVDMPWARNLSKNHNRLGEAARRNYKPDVRAWMDRLGWEVKAAMMGMGRRKLKPPVRVIVEFRYPDNRTRDDHNYYETICDAIKGVVGMDDDQIRISTGSIVVDPSYPGFRIEIEGSG
jgi:hypothetical protein